MEVEIETTLGCIRAVLHADSAPHSCAYFLGLVASGILDRSHVYRVVTFRNDKAVGRPHIEVIQMGLRNDNPNAPVIIPHESTAFTGLRHVRGTVSLSRYRPGAVYGGFFICYRTEPCLDHGGDRNPDRQGFAAIGSVIEGWPVIDAIYNLAGEDEYLVNPIPVIAVRQWNC